MMVAIAARPRPASAITTGSVKISTAKVAAIAASASAARRQDTSSTTMMGSRVSTSSGT